MAGSLLFFSGGLDLQISERFTIAVHILACVKYFEGIQPITSEIISGSIGVNAVIVRRILLQLKKAGILSITKGRAGISLAKPAEDITLYDVYTAVEAVGVGGLFRFHGNPNPDCPVGGKIHIALDGSLRDIQTAFEARMKEIKISDITAAI